MEEDKKEEMALFRYRLIAPLAAGTFSQSSKAAYYRDVAAMEHTLPDGKKARFSPSTIKKWHIKYGKAEYEKDRIRALTPKDRADAGKSRTLSEDVCRRIDELKAQFPHITGVKIRKKLIENGYMKETDASLDSIYRYLRTSNLVPGGTPPTEVVAFEFEHANDCWQADTSDGPVITIGTERVQTYLISFLDDASRVIVHGEFYLSDNAVNMQDAFKKAIKVFGLPRRLFDDNGGSYRNHQISYICAQLGVVEIHSKPYHPKGKGKEERSHRTMHQKWMDCTDWNEFHSLEALNKSYWEFLDKEYNNYPHSSLGKTPKERYLEDFSLIRFVDINTLEEAFLHRVTRKVSNTACISLANESYEVEQRFIGRKVSVRYRPEDLSEIYIYDNDTGKRLCVGKPVKKLDNAKRKRRANIDYGKMDGGNDHV